MDPLNHVSSTHSVRTFNMISTGASSFINNNTEMSWVRAETHNKFDKCGEAKKKKTLNKEEAFCERGMIKET